MPPDPTAEQEPTAPIEASPEVTPEGIKEESAKKRADLALEGKQPVLTSIEGLDPALSLEVQTEGVEALGGVIEALTLKALNAGKKEEELRANPGELQKYASREEEKMAVQKVREFLIGNYEASSQWWEKELQTAVQRHKDIGKEQKSIEEDGHPSGKTDWMSTSVRATLVLAGAVGAYELYKWWKKPKEEKGVGEAVAEGALITMGLGAALAPDTVGKWLAEYVGVSLSSDATHDFWEHLKKREYKEAFSSFEFNKRYPGIQKAAKEWNIPERTILDVKDVNWEEFSSLGADARRAGATWSDKALDWVGMSDVPGIGAKEKAKKAEEEAKLLEGIKAHQEEVDGDIDEMTIGEILNALDKKKIFDKTEGGSDGEAQKSKEGGSDAPEGTEEQMAETFPTVHAAIDTWKVDGDYGKAAKGILEGVWTDGGALVTQGTQSFIVKGAAAIPLSNFAIISETLADMADSEVSLTDSLLHKEQYPWMGGYAMVYGAHATVSGLIKGDLSFGKVLASMAKGAGRGYVDSYILTGRLVVGGIKLKAQGKPVMEYYRKMLERSLDASPEGKLWNLRTETAYYADEYARYHTLHENAGRVTGMEGVTAKIKTKLFGEKWVEEMMIKSGKRYLESRERLFKGLGREDGLEVTGRSFESESGHRDALARSAKGFANEIPESSLPEIPKYLVGKTRYATLAEADAAGLPRLNLSPELEAKMTQLGLDHERIVARLREMKMTEREVAQLIKEIETAPNARLMAKNFEVTLFGIKNPRLFRAVKGLTKGLEILQVIQILQSLSSSTDPFNTLGEEAFSVGGFILGMRVGAELPIPHAVAKLVAVPVTGAVVALGGGELWHSYCSPYVQKHFPNRNEWIHSENGQLVLDAVNAGSGGSAIDTAKYGLTKVGIMGGVDEDTDPLEYLKDSGLIWQPIAPDTDPTASPWDQVKAGVKHQITPYGREDFHTMDDFKSRSQEALKDAQEKLNEAEEALAANEAKIQEASAPAEKANLKKKNKGLEEKLATLSDEILTYQSYIDGSWLDIRIMKEQIIRLAVLEPAFKGFEDLVEKKFGAEGKTAYAEIMARMQDGGEGAAEGSEMAVWQYLCDQKISIQDESAEKAREVPFIDFISLTIANTQNLAALARFKEQTGVPSEVVGEGGGEVS